MNKNKVPAIGQWSKPASVKDIHSYLGFANFFKGGSFISFLNSYDQLPGYYKRERFLFDQNRLISFLFL